MSPLDASFLHIEDGVSHMHLASTAIFEGPVPQYQEVLAMVAGKLSLVPRYRQKVRFVPLYLGRPVWTDDAFFNIEYHVRNTALPSPGGDQELRNLVGRVMSQPLDRNRPLWEMWMVEGLDDGRWAILSKVHHCMVDGVAGTDLMSVIMDSTRQPDSPPPDVWSPDAEPSDLQLVSTAVGELISNPYEQVRAVRARVRGLQPVRELVGDLRTGLASLRPLAQATAPSSLNGPITPHRRWDWAKSTLEEVKTVRGGMGGTVNDVVLAAITNGFRELLSSRGEDVSGRVVRTLVPVSVRAPDQRGVLDNKVSAMFAELPVGIADPEERLDSIRVQMDDLKESKQALAGEVLTSLTGFAPPMLLALAGRAVSRVSQRNVNTVTTNVPGPQHALYAVGRELVEVFPYVPLAGSIRIGVAVFSYNGMINFGVTGDFDSAPDIGVLCRGIEAGTAEMVKLAENANPRPKPKRAQRRAKASRAAQ